MLSKKSYLALGALLAVLCVALAAFLLTRPTPPTMTDAQKLAKVYEMYQGYLKDFPKARDIPSQKALELYKNGKAIFVDVRPLSEREVSVLPGAITQEEYLNHRDKYKGKTPIFYCTISYRSGVLAQELEAKGIPALNLKGGLLAWVLEGNQVFGPDGKPVKRIHTYGRTWDFPPQGYQSVY